jgi:hypothetical protein
VIFFDEFDSIATARGGKMEDCSMHRRLLAELLLQLSLHSQNYSSTSSPTPSGIESEVYGDTQHPQHTFSSKSLPPNTPSNSHCSATLLTPGQDAASGLAPRGGDADPVCDSGLAAGADFANVVHCATATATTTAAATAAAAACPPPGTSHPEDNALVVVAATNRLEDLDEAIIRRFDSKVSEIHVSASSSSLHSLRIGNKMVDASCNCFCHMMWHLYFRRDVDVDDDDDDDDDERCCVVAGCVLHRRAGSHSVTMLQDCPSLILTAPSLLHTTVLEWQFTSACQTRQLALR